MSINALPDPPAATDPVDTFDAKAFAFNAALLPFRTQVNATADTIQINADILAAVLIGMSFPEYSGTSSGSVAVGTGEKVFPTQTGKLWAPGQIVVVSSGGNIMRGPVVGYSGGNLTVNVTSSVGSGTSTGWTIGLTFDGLLLAKSGANADITSLSALTSINGGSIAGRRNKIVNAWFSINQRSVSGTVILPGGQYGHDRWRSGAAGCIYTFTVIEGVTTITIQSGTLLQVVRGRYLRSGTHVLSWSGTAQGRIGAGAYAASGVAAPVTGGANVIVEFGPGTLAKVQLEPGTVATVCEAPFDDEELLVCQRSTQIVVGGYGGPSTNGANSSGIVTIPVQMESTPTVTWLNSVYVSNFVGGQAYASNIETNGFRVLKTASATATDSAFMERFLLSTEP